MDKKVERIINIFNRVTSGEVINKAEEAERFGVNTRSIQRDLEDIRTYFPTGRNPIRSWFMTGRKRVMCWSERTRMR